MTAFSLILSALAFGAIVSFVDATCDTAYISWSDRLDEPRSYLYTYNFALGSHSYTVEIGSGMYRLFGLAQNPVTQEFYVLGTFESGAYSNLNRSLYKFDIDDPKDLTLIKTYTDQDDYLSSITFGGCDSKVKDPTLYGIGGVHANYTYAKVFTINLDDGSLTKLTTYYEYGGWGRGIAFNPYDGYLYTLGYLGDGGEDDGHDIIRIHPTTGEKTYFGTTVIDKPEDNQGMGIYNATHLIVITTYEDMYFVEISTGRAVWIDNLYYADHKSFICTDLSEQFGCQVQCDIAVCKNN